MSTSHPQFTARIEGSPEIIFDLMPTCRIMIAGCPVQKRSAGQRRYRHIRTGTTNRPSPAMLTANTVSGAARFHSSLPSASKASKRPIGAEDEAEWKFTELFKAKIEGDCSHEDSLAQVGSNQLFQGETFISLIPSLGKFDPYQIPESLTHSICLGNQYAMETHVPRNQIGP